MTRIMLIPVSNPLIVLTALALLTACREDPGPVDKALLEGWENPSELFPEPVPGPDPYVEGENRFGLGLFYEGGLSDFSPIDGVTSNYFIFEAFPGGPLTYTSVEDTQSVVEGLNSTRISHAGLTFWGGGIFWTAPRNVSRWAVMHVSLRSTSTTFADIRLGVQSGSTDFFVSAADYGYVNDGQWHHLLVPLADFVEDGADLSNLTSPFIMSGGAGTSGEVFNVDALYWTQP